MTTTAHKTAIVSCMRNEGLFVLEWVAYHRAIGFDDVLIVTNDCTDGSAALLDRMQDLGLLTHIAQTVPDGASPQDLGMSHALAWAADQHVEWVLHIDSDEFLNVLAGQGMLGDLMQRVEQADVVAVPWRAFGDCGLNEWTAGASVLNSFIQAETAPIAGETKFKSMFRPALFENATDHNPRNPKAADPKVVNADGAELSNKSLYRNRSSRYHPVDLATNVQTAHLNHYAVKSQDLFLMKNDRGDGQGKQGGRKYHIGAYWHKAINKNEVEDRTILRHWPRVQELLDSWRTDAELAKREQDCQDWFIARRASLLTPQQRAAWTRNKRAVE